MKEDYGVDCLVKLGGAAITIKDKLETLDDEVLDTTISHLIETLNPPDTDGPAPKLVVVHGAGSFGHFQASETGVAKVRPLSLQEPRGEYR